MFAKHAVIIGSVLLMAGTLRAAGTKDEAEAMVNKAVDLIKSAGAEKAYDAFTQKAEGFAKEDLYIFVVGYDGMTLAHGGNSKLVGKDMSGLKDADGKFFIKAMIESAEQGGGWVDYKWTNPETKKVQDKSTFVKPVDDLKAFVGCGIYK